MRSNSSAAWLVAAFISVCLLTSAGIAAAETAPDFDSVTKRLGYTPDDKAALLKGGIIAKDLQRTRDDQLVAAVAIVVSIPLTTLAENARKGLNIERDDAITAFGRLEGPPAADQFAGARYSESDRSEVERLLEASTDGTFNLSKAELSALRESLAGVPADRVAAAEQASRAYQKILVGRHQAYLEKGLDGIADYEAGPRLEPAEKLRGAFEQAKPFLDEYFPAFSNALGQFPAGQTAGIANAFYWMKRDVEGRPTFVLAHQTVQSADDFVLLSQRQYFVGHTYDSLQAIALAIPCEGGSAVFYVNSAYTDKITGFFSGVAQSVGQGRTKEDLIEYFDRARKTLQ